MSRFLRSQPPQPKIIAAPASTRIVSGSTNPLTLTASQSQVATRPNALVGWIRSLGQAKALTTTRVMSVTRSASEPQSAASVRQTAATKPLAQAQGLTSFHQVGAIRSVLQGEIATFGQVIGRLIATVASTSPSVLKLVALAKQASQSSAVSVISGQARLVTLAITQASSSSLRTLIQSIRSPSTTAQASSRRDIAKGISQSQGSSATSVAGLLKTFALSATSSAGSLLNRVVSIGRSPTVSSSSAITRSIGIARAASSGTTSLFGQAYTKTINVVAHVLASLSARSITQQAVSDINLFSDTERVYLGRTSLIVIDATRYSAA